MRSAIALAFLTLLLPALQGFAQEVAVVGKWQGVIVVGGDSHEIELRIKEGGGILTGTVEIVGQGVGELPIRSISATRDSLQFSIPDAPGNPTFLGRLSAGNDSLVGVVVVESTAMPCALARALGVSDDRIKQLRADLSRILADSRVPGMAVAVVKDGKVLMSEGFGVCDRARGLQVSDTTEFPIGSCTKAFTATLLGTIVDEGRLDWDTPVQSYLPDFQLYDTYTTSHITPRDLLSHTSGLPRYDLLWYGNNNLSRADLVERLRYLEPTADLRQEWQYQNLMVMVAGYMAGRLLDTTWEAAVQGRILSPLRMEHTTFTVDAMQASRDASLGYERRRDSTYLLPYFTSTAIGPAGTINSCARDMARWLLMNLNGGELEGTRVVSSGTLREIHRPQVVINDGGDSDGPEQLFDLYALGWSTHAWRGHRMVEHGGNIDGFTAQVGLLPDDEIGVAVLANSDGSEMPTVVMRTVFDRLLGVEGKDWGGEMARQMRAEESEALALADDDDDDDEEGGARVAGTSPSHPVADYAGFYEHPAFGVVEVLRSGRGLRLRYGRIDTRVEHFHYDVFRTEAEDTINGWFNHIRLNFRSDVNGRIEGFEARLETSAPPVFFERRPPPAMSDTAQLDRYVGRYQLSGRVVTVFRAGSHLVVRVPGQPSYTLDPLEMDLFKLRELDGYRVRFEVKNGRAISATFLQPNGTFIARRAEE